MKKGFRTVSRSTSSHTDTLELPEGFDMERARRQHAKIINKEILKDSRLERPIPPTNEHSWEYRTYQIMKDADRPMTRADVEMEYIRMGYDLNRRSIKETMNRLFIRGCLEQIDTVYRTGLDKRNYLTPIYQIIKEEVE